MISIYHQAEELTRQVIESFYHQDLNLLIQKLHPDVTWIGAADGECIKGYEQVCEYIKNIDVPRCDILKKEFQVVANSDDIFIVAGWMEVAASQGSSEVLGADVYKRQHMVCCQKHQRCDRIRRPWFQTGPIDTG